MRSIRGKLLITLLSTALLSTIVIAFFLLQDSEKMAYTMIKDTNLAEMNNVRDFYFDKLIEDMENTVIYWADESALKDYGKMPSQPHITRSIPENFMITYKKWLSVVESSGDISWLYFGLQEDGSIFIAPTDTTMPLDYDCRTRIWYQDAISDPERIHWSEPYLDAGDSGKMVQTVSKAVVKEGIIIGVFGVDIEVGRFNDMLQTLSREKDSKIFVLNDEGTVIAETESVGSVLEKYSIDSLEEEQNLIREIDGEQHLVTVLPFPSSKWILIGVRPVNLEESLAKGRQKVLFIALIQIVITLFLGYMVADKLLMPVETLLKVVDGVSKGDIKQRANLKSKDEFGDLSRGFDVMLDNIEELFYERDHHLKTLKKKNIEIVRGKEEIVAFSSQVQAMNDELSRLLNELGDNYLSTVKALANAIEASDDYTRGHCERVGEISKLLGDELHLTLDRMRDLDYACVLHDIGKIAISDKILNKRQNLTKDELSMIKMHPLIGYEIIKDVSFLKDPSQILLQHHERVDGKGYPYGLNGEEILLEARILSVADAYDAMTSARAYRQIPLSKEKVLEELEKGRGTQFDPQVIDALIGLLSETEYHL